MNFYDQNKPTYANYPSFDVKEKIDQQFTSEGLYIGTFSSPDVELPALVNVEDINGLCFFYDTEELRQKVNRCLERLTWRIALTVPANICDLVLYNGGNPGK